MEVECEGDSRAGVGVEQAVQVHGEGTREKVSWRYEGRSAWEIACKVLQT